MSNSQTPGEVGGEVGLRRLGLPRPAPGLREAPNASQLDALGLPQSCLRASSLPKGHVGLRAQVPVGEGVCYGDGNLGVCTKRGLNGARGAPPERGSDPDKIRAGFSQKSAEEKRFQAGESVPVCSFSAAVEAELIEAAKRTVESYREDGPQIGFVFDEVPVVGTSMAEIKGGVGRALQQDFNHTAGEAWNLVSACRPPAFGAPWGFMYPPILPPVAHALATHRHPRLWGGAEGRKQHFFGYGHPPRSPINEPHNGLFGIAYQGSSSCDKIKDGTSSEGKTIDTQVTSKEKQDKSDGSLKKQESPLLLILKGFNNTNEDSELEMQKLMSMKLSTMSESEQAEVIKLEQSGQSLQDILKIKLPQFPNICEKPHNSVLAKILDKGILGNLLMVWGTLYSFGDMLGLWPCTIDDLAEAFLEGRGSKLLAEVHVGLLRLLIAEMEEAHISGTEKAVAHIDRATVSSAQTLDEAWAWGFDVDIWRAHLNSITWPEILRQFAIAAGLGPTRPKPKREARPKIGSAGEDLVEDNNGVGFNLCMPTRFSPGSVKAAAWMVLAEAGPEGLPVQEIARQIQKKGLRDLSTSKTPEASVVGGLSRDMVFCRVAPATYALQSVISHHRQLLTSTRTQQKAHSPRIVEQDQHSALCGSSRNTSTQSSRGESKHDQLTGNSQQPGTQRSESSDWDGVMTCCDNQMEKDMGCADVSTEFKCGSGDKGAWSGGLRKQISCDPARKNFQKTSGEESWVERLLTEEYDCLSIKERMDALCALCNIATEGPSVRSRLDAKLDQGQRNKKHSHDEFQSAQCHSGIDLKAEEPRLATAAYSSSSKQTENGTKSNATHTSKERKARLSKPTEITMRMEPLGYDRRYNRYWLFRGSLSSPVGRLFVENSLDGGMQVIHHPQQLDELKQCLEPRGLREGLLLRKIAAVEKSIRESMELMKQQSEQSEDVEHCAKRRKVDRGWVGSSALMEVAGNIQPLAAEFKLDASRMPAKADYKEVGGQSSQPESLETSLFSKFKEDLLLVEAVISGDGFVEEHEASRSEWQASVCFARTIEDLRDCLGDLESNIAQRIIYPGFQKSPPSLAPGVWSISTEGTRNLDWLPNTLPALFLRLLALDAALTYQTGVAPGRESLHAYNYIQRPLAPELVDPSSSVPPEGSMLLSNLQSAVRACIRNVV